MTLTIDTRQFYRLPLAARDQLLAWLRDVAPPEVAENTCRLTLHEGHVEVTYYLVNERGHRYLAPGTRDAAQATWQTGELPPEEPFRRVASCP